MFSVCVELQSPNRPLVRDLSGLLRRKRSNELNFPAFAPVPLWAKGHLTGVKSPRSDPDMQHNQSQEIFFFHVLINKACNRMKMEDG